MNKNQVYRNSICLSNFSSQFIENRTTNYLELKTILILVLKTSFVFLKKKHLPLKNNIYVYMQFYKNAFSHYLFFHYTSDQIYQFVIYSYDILLTHRQTNEIYFLNELIDRMYNFVLIRSSGPKLGEYRVKWCGCGQRRIST